MQFRAELLAEIVDRHQGAVLLDAPELPAVAGGRPLDRGGDLDLWLKRLQWQVGAEFALGMGVMAAVGALGAMSPPISG